jgi:hypothetical protein
LLAGFLSTSVSRGRHEEPENRMKWPFTAIPDTRLWLRINVFGLQVGPAFYTFWQTPVDFMPVPGVPEPKVTGWTRVWQRLRNWATSYDKGLSSKKPTFYTFHFLGFLVWFNEVPILDHRVLFKEIARERQARMQVLDLWTGASRQIGKLIFRLRGPVTDRWAERAFRHLVNHAQRMLVRNLTEQAWQRKQLAKASTERARKRLQAALDENIKRATEIREYLDRLPGRACTRRGSRRCTRPGRTG